MHITSILKTFSLCVLFSFILFTKEGRAAEISPVVTVTTTSSTSEIIINRGRTHIFPANGQIQINNGESCATTREVTLKISAQNASEVVISNNQNFVGTNRIHTN